MMIELIDSLVNILGPIATSSRENEAKKDQALRAVSYALDETYLYYRDLRNGNLQDREREAQLVKLWSAAAIPLRHFDFDLANICDMKSEYWINPDQYTEDQVQEMGIKLDDVRGAYRKLLKPRNSMFQRR